MRTERGRKGVVKAIHETKDPSTFTVLLEDSAALLGLLFAFAGIFLGSQLELPYLDGVASVLIGGLLCGVAVLMVYESKGLLIGEGLDRESLRSIRALVEADPAVEWVGHLHTMYLGPHEVLLTIELRFHPQITALEVRQSARRLRETAQLMCGLPDYDRYVEHVRRDHPGAGVMSRRDFERWRQDDRNDNPRARCC